MLHSLKEKEDVPIALQEGGKTEISFFYLGAHKKLCSDCHYSKKRRPSTTETLRPRVSTHRKERSDIKNTRPL